MDYKDKVDLVVEAIVNAKRLEPDQRRINLYPTKENKLCNLKICEIQEIIKGLQKGSKEAIVLLNVKNLLGIPSKEIYYKNPPPNKIYFKLRVHNEKDEFDNWYCAYSLRYKDRLNNLDALHFEIIYSLVQRIYNKLQIRASSNLSMKLCVPNKFLLAENPPENLSEKKELIRDALEYLHKSYIIRSVIKNSYDINCEYLETEIKVNMKRFSEFKTKIEKVFKERRSEINKQKNKVCPFASDDMSWGDITIKFLNDQDVEIVIKNKQPYKTNYEEMGFRNAPDKKSPGVAWSLLKVLAIGNQKISTEKLREELGDDIARQQKKELSDTLKSYFGIKENPIHTHEGEHIIKLNLIPE